MPSRRVTQMHSVLYEGRRLLLAYPIDDALEECGAVRDAALRWRGVHAELRGKDRGRFEDELETVVRAYEGVHQALGRLLDKMQDRQDDIAEGPDDVE